MTTTYVVLGNFSIDEVISPLGEHAQAQLGGTALYGCAGARIWSDAVGICTVVGADYIDRVRRTLQDHGVDISGIKVVPRNHGLVWFTGYLTGETRVDVVEEFAAAAGRVANRRYVVSGSPRHQRLWPIFSPAPEDIPPEYHSARGYHLAPMPTGRLIANAQLLKRSDSHVSMDWPFWRGTTRRVLNRPLLRAIDAALPSQEDVERYSDEPVESVMRQIADVGPRTVVVKRGAVGVRVFNVRRGVVTDVPAFPTAVRDPTGAGDAFCGGFMVGMGETGDPVLAAMYGVISSSFVIESFGVEHALRVRRSQAEERLYQLRQCIETQPDRQKENWDSVEPGRTVAHVTVE